jgi:hypothetical protein
VSLRMQEVVPVFQSTYAAKAYNDGLLRVGSAV